MGWWGTGFNVHLYSWYPLSKPSSFKTEIQSHHFLWFNTLHDSPLPLEKNLVSLPSWHCTESSLSSSFTLPATLNSLHTWAFYTTPDELPFPCVSLWLTSFRHLLSENICIRGPSVNPSHRPVVVCGLLGTWPHSRGEHWWGSRNLICNYSCFPPLALLAELHLLSNLLSKLQWDYEPCMRAI